MEAELDAFERGVEGDEGGSLGGVLQGELVGLSVASAPAVSSKRMGGLRRLLTVEETGRIDGSERSEL